MNKSVRIVISKHGGPDVLEVCREVTAEPKSNEVRVRVLAAGVGYSDVMAQRGGYPLAPRPPFTPGYDFAGVVDKVGENVQDFKEGQHVVALNPFFGCYSEYVCIPSKFLVPFSAALAPAEVCSLVLNYLTADCILHKKAAIKPGQTVLVHSAAGGVGSALVQLCVLNGVNVFGTASLGKHEFVKKLGAMPIDYKSADFAEIIRSLHPDGIDAAFDPIGGKNLRRSYSIVRRGGKVVSYGFSGSNFGGLLPMMLGVAQLAYLNMLPDGKRVRLCALPAESKKNILWYKQALSSLIRLLEEGKINPIVGAKIPLSEAYRAHTLLESGKITGKIILQCA